MKLWVPISKEWEGKWLHSSRRHLDTLGTAEDLVARESLGRSIDGHTGKIFLAH